MKTQLKKAMIVALVCALVLSLFAGCAGGASSSAAASSAAPAASASKAESAAGAEVTGHLRIMSQQQVENPEGPLQQEIAQGYLDQNPGVTIEWIGVPANETVQKITAMAAADDLPDIFGSGNEFYPNAIEMGIIIDLKTILPQEFLDKFYPNLLDVVTVDGFMAATPMFCMVSGMLYRADWLEEEGIDPPETWDEFSEACKQLTKDTDGDGQIDRWGFAMIGTRNQSGESRYNYIQRSFGVTELYQDGSGNWVSDIGSDAYKDVLEMFCNFTLVDDIVPPGVLETSYSEAANLIVSEKACFILSGSNAVGTITAQNPDLRGKLASMVIPMGTQKIANPSTTGFSVSTACKDLDAASGLLQWFLTDENMLKWNAVTGHVPTSPNVADDPQLQSLEMKGFMEALQYSYKPPQHPAILEIQDAMGEAYQSVIAGNATVDQAAEKAQQRVEEAIASYE